MVAGLPDKADFDNAFSWHTDFSNQTVTVAGRGPCKVRAGGRGQMQCSLQTHECIFYTPCLHTCTFQSTSVSPSYTHTHTHTFSRVSIFMACVTVLGFVWFLYRLVVWWWWGSGGEVITMIGKANRMEKKTGTQPLSHGSYFFQYWSNGNLCFLCFRMFRWGGADSPLFVLYKVHQ